MKNNKKEIMKLIIKLNLILGMYNLFLYAQGHMFFNLLIGSVNIGVWVFYKDIKNIISNKLS
ncbi:MAG: hypothetical protein CMG50_03845 [Candidatus Marinimicrobia bacterium]|nr:hypothetical protein [Candidatus Neomarinimicrobiota bacterium]|tara:strand:- start:17002 stop:17187 length:186 start_codon:yes stop_codon:yes gene_type:complete